MWRTKNCGAPSCRALAEQGKDYCAAHQNYVAEHEKFLKEQRPWHLWYGRVHWKRLRTLVLARDPICVICNRAPATDADHIIPHKGDWFLFCGGVNMQNLQGLCATCHSEKTAREDAGFGNIRMVN
jgi:5-methylcytosine-specific restriction enzyme A